VSSTVDICNKALVLLGADQIASLTEDSEEARLVAAQFDTARDTVLRAYPWNCAMTRQALAQDATAPISGYAAQFQLPSDPFCLRALEINDDPGAAFKIEGRLLLTDEGAVTLRYVARVTDTEQYDALLVAAIAARLASFIAYAVSGSRQVQVDMLDAYKDVMSTAKTADAQEGTPDVLIADEWELARFGP
jgi:hypothetical protein